VIFIVMGCITLPSLVAVAYIFLNRSEQYTAKIAQDRLVNLRNSRAQTLIDFLGANVNIISQFSNTQAAVNGSIDFKDGLPSAADAVLESVSEKKGALLKATKEVGNYYQGTYLSAYQKFNPGSNKLLEFMPRDMDGILLQDGFIAKNDFPIGERYKLLSSDIVPTYSVFHEKYHPKILDFVQKHQYYDAMLINAESNVVVYSSLKEADFGLNVYKSELKNTALFKVYEKAKKAKAGETLFEDFSFYPPSLGRPIGFFASPVYLDGRLISILIIKIQTNLISNTISNYFSWQKDGLGDTGDVFITGGDGLLRNDSRRSVENPSGFLEHLANDGRKNEYQMYLLTNSAALIEKNNSRAFIRANQGKAETASYVSLGSHQVIGSYRPIYFQDLNWIISAEIDESEASNLAAELNRYIWLSVLAVALILIPLSFLIARLFLKPFNRLIEAMDRIYNTNNLTLRLKGKFTTEINSLISSFNKMLEQLQYNEQVITTAKDNIEDSIEVANRVLINKLPSKSEFHQSFAGCGILWTPRDTVGGDVYWLKDFGSRIYLACIDCTGHGVPGAFIAINALSAFEEIPNTSYEWYELPEVVSAIQNGFQEKFKRMGQSSDFKDGFALSLLCFDKYSKTISFVGMGQDCIIKHSDGSSTFLKGNRKSIGTDSTLEVAKIQFQTQEWIDSDAYILYSDGLVTQVGDSKKRMMGTSYVLDQIALLDGNDPQNIVDTISHAFDEWRGSLEARDDLTIIAVKPKSLG
jgi:serine phosphatase RsbU (regulator of sigma subunit)